MSNGIKWLSEPVHKGTGADKIEHRKDAQIPHVENLDDARKFFGDAAVLAGINGTSWRVAAQDVARRCDRKTSVEELRELVIARLKGIRTAGATKVREVIRVPRMDGQGFVTLSGDEAADLAALVDAGFPAEVARQLLNV